MATRTRTNNKKATRSKGKDPGREQQDPPIIVGGGGSTLIWIKKNQFPTQLDPVKDVPASAPGPPVALRGNYYCYKCVADVKHVTVHDGATTDPRKPVDKQKHKTNFEDV